jgi:hypothetical protein
MNGNRLDAKALARLDDSAGNFTAVGNEHFIKKLKQMQGKGRREA